MRNVAINTLLITAGGLGWLFTLQPKPSLFILVHYGLLVAAIVGAVRVCAGKWQVYRKWIIIGGTAAGICLVILYGQHDYYRSSWTNERGTKYVDTYHRWSGRIVHRWVLLPDGSSLGTSLNGPMRGEGKPKPHGKWIRLGRGGLDYTFYWYGDEVSEGEWHLRNK